MTIKQKKLQCVPLTVVMSSKMVICIKTYNCICIYIFALITCLLGALVVLSVYYNRLRAGVRKLEKVRSSGKR